MPGQEISFYASTVLQSELEDRGFYVSDEPIYNRLHELSDKLLEDEMIERGFYVYKDKPELEDYSIYDVKDYLQESGYWVYDEEMSETSLRDYDDDELRDELRERQAFFMDYDLLEKDDLSWILSQLGEFKLGSEEDMIIRKMRDMYNVGK